MGAIAVGLNPHQRGLMGGLLAGIAEGVIEHVRQPATEAIDAGGGTGVACRPGAVRGGIELGHGPQGEGPFSMIRLARGGNQ